jgi:organic hydroperoxide reductase OsmC/OhrA
MSTFLALAERAGLSFTGYESDAQGRLEFVNGKFRFTTIVLHPRISLKPGEDPSKAKELMTKAEANCLISNSITAHVAIEANIS